MTTERESNRSRDEFLQALEAGDLARAGRAARAVLGGSPRPHQLSFVGKAVDRMPPDSGGLVSRRVALLSSFSIEFLHDPLIALAFVDGLRLDLYQAGFGQFRQEILSPESGLYRANPDVVVLAVEGRDLVPSVYSPAADDSAPARDKAVAAAGEELATLIRTFRERSAATLLVHNFALPLWRQLGILDSQAEHSQARLVADLNEALSAVCRETPGVYVVDYAGLVSRAGADQWYDRRMQHYARAPIGHAQLPRLAGEYLKFLRALTGKAKKCLVVDLDNTLWGGVLGEEGPHGIQLGPTYPGSAYLAFQEAILGLHQRGIILAVASKNNVPDVEEVFAKHPHMLLKREHFAQTQVHWGSKSDSLVEIASKLNIGLDHLVFVDDNPAECQQVMQALPMVTVIGLPAQPELFVGTLLDAGLFDTLGVSSEDARRGELYQQRDQAEELRQQSGSLEEFYTGLDMEVIFAPVGHASLARAAQLTQKTNQFTVTTLRYSEAEIARRAADPDWLATTVRVRDRFGDNGIVGVMLARRGAEEATIDTLLLSCRVIGRTVETAMLAFVSGHARRWGVRRLIGEIVPTAKNEPVRDLYAAHGFQRISEAPSGGTTWQLDLGEGGIEFPRWLKIVTET